MIARNFIIYGLIGVVSASVDYLIFCILLYIYGNENYLYHHTSSYVIGTIVSFILNTKYNFKVNDKIKIRLLKFFVVGISGLIGSIILMYTFSSSINFSENESKIIVIFTIAIYQYLLNKKITFKT